MRMINMEDNDLKIKAYNRIDEIFKTSINSIIEEAIELEDDSPDDFLISLHFAFKQLLQKSTGTARNVEGLSEMWYFIYIRKFLERYLKIQFIPKRKHSPESVHYHYEANYRRSKLILTSDLSLTTNFGLKIHSNPRKRPDIFIGLRQKDKDIIPIAFFEIKLYQRTSSNVKEVLDRFIQMRDILEIQNISIPFFVFLYLQHSQYQFGKKRKEYFDFQLKQFKKLLPNSRLLVNRILKWDTCFAENEIEGSIYEIMMDIISFIEVCS